MQKTFQKLIACLTLTLLMLFAVPSALLIPTAAAAPATAKQALEELTQAAGSCVASSSALETCTSTAPSARQGVQDDIFPKLYQAIWSQGAVITLLDEPLSDKNLITVLKICNYQKDQISGASKLNTCNEYYTEKCPDTSPQNTSSKFQNNLSDEEIKTALYYTCQTKQVILANSGAGLAQQYLKMIYDFGTTLAGIIAVLIIMINGIKIIISGSDDSAVSEAKTQITTSLIALAVLFMSGFILYIINPNFFTA